MYNLIDYDKIREEFPILNEKESFIINFVSCDGIMGTALGNRLKYLFPEMYNSYKNSCLSNENNLDIGKILLWRKTNPFIINIPVKKNWKEEYSEEYLKEGLIKISQIHEKYKIQKVSIQEEKIKRETIIKITSEISFPEIIFYSN